MPEAKRFPYMKFYARDWRGDGALRMCSFAARGLWADILSLIHDEGEPYGHLCINGQKPSDAQIARMLGASTQEVKKLLSELDAAGVFDRVSGAIVSRRMVRDMAKAEEDRRNGKGGGNPKLKAPDNGGDNPHDKAHIPEARTIAKENNNALARFDEFYEAYPKKVNRGAAERAWQKALETSEPGAIIVAAGVYARSRAGKDEKFTPYPASWLKDKCWLDEGLTPSGPLPTPEEIEAARDKADKYFKRGKYAVSMQ